MAKRQDRPAVFDRTPPQNIEAERSVLGAMLLNPDAVGVAIEILRETAGDVFYVEAHQHVYAAIVGLFRANVPVDAVTVVDQLTKDGHLEASGGASYVAELSGAVPTSANVEHYARIVLDAAVLRKLISTCSLMVGEAYDVPGDVNDLLDRAEMGIFSISEARQLNPLHRVGDLIPGAVTRIENLISAHTGISGLATGFTRLDELLSGLQPSDMIVLAARPSIGKTAFALNIAGNMAIRDGKSVLLFSLEMAKEQLTQRLLCYEGHIDTQRLRTGFLAGKDFPKLQEAADRLSRAAVYIDGELDPHIWMDVSLWLRGADVVAEALARGDPKHADLFRQRAAETKERLAGVDRELQEAMAQVPLRKRYLVSSHDAFNYFTRRYLAEGPDWKKHCIAPEGLSPEGQLSLAQLGEVIDHLECHQISVLFPESNLSRDAMERIVAIGAKRGIPVRLSTEPLYADAMGEGQTYADMMRHNARVISENLQQSRP